MLRDVLPEETDGEMGVRGTTESRSEDQSRMKSEVSRLYWPPTVLRARLRTPTPHKLASERLASERLASERTTEEIEDTETLEERSTMLDNQILMYANLVKAQRVAKLKREFEGLVAEESVYSGKADLRQQGMRDNRGRRVDMLKVEVGIFRRGTSDEVLNSIANFNIAVKACGLEAVSYSERIGTVEEEVDLATLLGRFVSKDHQVVASMRAEFGERGGSGSQMMRHLRDNFVDSLVYESTDPEVDLQQVNWVSVMKGGGTEIKTSLDKVWAMTKLMPEGRRGTEKFWIKHVMDRVPPSLAF
jgi:hypothetical protein